MLTRKIVSLVLLLLFVAGVGVFASSDALFGVCYSVPYGTQCSHYAYHHGPYGEFGPESGTCRHGYELVQWDTHDWYCSYCWAMWGRIDHVHAY